MSVAWLDSVTITVEVAFTTDPLDTAPSYTDISAYVMGMDIKPGGRKGGLDQFQAGTLSLTLNNTDRRFDPLYTSGAYQPNVLPRKKVRVSVTYSAVTYRLFTGFMDSWANTGEQSNTLGLVNATATDGFKMLSRNRLPITDTPEGDGETIAARMGRLLDYGGWPATFRDIDADSPTMVALVPSGQPVMDELYIAANGDLGSIFMAGDGDFTYHGHRWQLANNLTTSATFGEVSPELQYSDIVFTYDDVLIFNRAIGTAYVGASATPVTVDIEDATSIADYGEQARSLGTVGVNNANVLQNTLEFIIANYKDAKMRVEQLGVNPRSSPATLYPIVLAATPGVRWTVKRRPQNVGTAISQDVIIESVAHSVTVDSWQTTVTLSQAPTPTGGGSYWRMGVSTWGTTAVWA